jgi:hypothetical protein
MVNFEILTLYLARANCITQTSTGPRLFLVSPERRASLQPQCLVLPCVSSLGLRSDSNFFHFNIVQSKWVPDFTCHIIIINAQHLLMAITLSPLGRLAYHFNLDCNTLPSGHSLSNQMCTDQLIISISRWKTSMWSCSVCFHVNTVQNATKQIKVQF